MGQREGDDFPVLTPCSDKGLVMEQWPLGWEQKCPLSGVGTQGTPQILMLHLMGKGLSRPGNSNRGLAELEVGTCRSWNLCVGGYGWVGVCIWEVICACVCTWVWRLEVRGQPWVLFLRNYLLFYFETGFHWAWPAA